MRSKHKRVIDRSTIESSNFYQKKRIDATLRDAQKYRDDPHRSDRMKRAECIVCFGSSRIGGAAVTTIVCGICETEVVFGNTATDVLCQACAHRNELCKRCGADIDLRNRLKPRDYELNQPGGDDGK